MNQELEKLNGAEGEMKRFLSFSLGEEEYAMPLLQVREVIAMPEVTPVPQTPNYFLGIMNLRGQVITVIDLRTKLTIKPTDSAEQAVIICDLSPLCIGVVVDSINSVISPRGEELSDKPEIKNSKCSEYIYGVYRKEKDLVLLLDVGRVLSSEDHASAAKAAGAKKAA